jgi:hypothetical protein
MVNARHTVIASRLAPTGDLRGSRHLLTAPDLWELGLP